MKRTVQGYSPWQLVSTLACAGLLILLTGCGGGEEESGSNPDPGPPPPPVSGDLDAERVDLAHSALDVTSKLVMVSHIVNTMLRDHIVLVRAKNGNPLNIPQCAGSPHGYADETNRVSYRNIDWGYQLPAGPSLHVALSECTIDGVTISGTIDITRIQSNGDPAGNDDWQVETEVWMGPVQIHNDNGTVTSFTDSYTHTANHTLNVLRTRIEVDADLDQGLIGGINVQHYTAPFSSDAAAINFQLRPFRVDTIEDANSGEYRVEITNHAEGPSTLSRYTNGANDEVLLRIRTQVNEPLLWTTGRPDSHSQPPASGSVMLEETCAGCASMQASVVSDGVVLTITHGPSVTSGTIDWSTLLSPLPAP